MKGLLCTVILFGIPLGIGSHVKYGFSHFKTIRMNENKINIIIYVLGLNNKKKLEMKHKRLNIKVLVCY